MKRITFAACATSAAFAIALSSFAVFAASDGLDPARLLQPLGEQWTSYSGDYTGRRYSALTQVNQSNVKSLTLAWVHKLSGPPSSGGGGRGRGGGFGAPGVETIVGGE